MPRKVGADDPLVPSTLVFCGSVCCCKRVGGENEVSRAARDGSGSGGAGDKAHDGAAEILHVLHLSGFQVKAWLKTTSQSYTVCVPCVVLQRNSVILKR